MCCELSEAIRLIQTGDWDAAHEIVQSRADQDAAWIHAHLHRLEGDDGNAAYWYRRAGKPFPKVSTDQEFRHLMGQFC